MANSLESGEGGGGGGGGGEYNQLLKTKNTGNNQHFLNFLISDIHITDCSLSMQTISNNISNKRHFNAQIMTY